MSHLIHDLCTNRLLAKLPREAGAHLASLGRIEQPPQGRILTSASEPGTDVWFPHTGAVALITTDAAGRSVQTGMVGCEGCVGLESVFVESRATQDAVVQVAGAMSVIPAIHVRSALDARPQVQNAVSNFLHGLTAQTLQTIACNRLHSLSARCCRWLLTLQDRSRSADLAVTQEELATLLGGGRPRVNQILASLEMDGLLRRHRGRIHLQTRAGLEHRSCECYRIVRDVTGPTECHKIRDTTSTTTTDG